MELAAVLVAGAAVVVAIIAFVRGELREHERSKVQAAAAKTADERFARAEERAVMAEQREQQREAHAEVERHASQQGWPTTNPATPEPGPGRAYRFTVTNVGKSWMTDLVAELVDSAGEVCSEELPNHFLDALQAGDHTEFVLKVSEPIDRDPLYLHYTWRDGQGVSHTHVSNVTVPLA